MKTDTKLLLIKLALEIYIVAAVTVIALMVAARTCGL